jgi:hypothetical protein
MQPVSEVEVMEVVRDRYHLGSGALQHVRDLVDVVAGVDPDHPRAEGGGGELPAQRV